MAQPYCGTITVALKTADFAVLVADRIGVQGDRAAPSDVRYAVKIAAHPTLPLAIAVGGMGTVETGTFPEEKGEVELIDVLAGMYRRLEKPNDLKWENLLRRIEADVVPRVRNQRLFSMRERPGGV